MQVNYTSCILGCLLFLFCSFAHATVNDTDALSLVLGHDVLLSRQADSPSLVNATEFKRTITSGHNWYRSQHGAPLVSWNEKRATASAAHSRKCVFKHSGVQGAGENIAAGFINVAGVVNAWGGERRLYDFSHPGYTNAVGHFTQVVWKNTNSIGCGRTHCPGIGWFVVCQYAPPGNFIGVASFTANVGRQIRGKLTDKWVR